MILKTKKIGETIWSHEFLFEIHHGRYGYPESVLAGKQHKKSLNSTFPRALYWWCQNTERTMFYLMIYPPPSIWNLPITKPTASRRIIVRMPSKLLSENRHLLLARLFGMSSCLPTNMKVKPRYVFNFFSLFFFLFMGGGGRGEGGRGGRVFTSNSVDKHICFDRQSLMEGRHLKLFSQSLSWPSVVKKKKKL